MNQLVSKFDFLLGRLAKELCTNTEKLIPQTDISANIRQLEAKFDNCKVLVLSDCVTIEEFRSFQSIKDLFMTEIGDWCKKAPIFDNFRMVYPLITDSNNTSQDDLWTLELAQTIAKIIKENQEDVSYNNHILQISYTIAKDELKQGNKHFFNILNKNTLSLRQMIYNKNLGKTDDSHRNSVTSPNEVPWYNILIYLIIQ